MKVLIVEDDKATRELYQQVIHTLDLEPVSFEDAESAWALCEKEYFPIMILDWLLPKMSGLELCRKVRSLANGKWTYIMVATVKAEAKDLRTVLKAGADDYISKPMDLGHMKIRLEIAKNNATKLLERQQAEKQLKDLREQVLIAEKLISVRGMVSGVSHELNNPLQGILGLSELLASEVKDEEMRKDIITIRQLAERCKSIVHDLLIFSEGENGRKSVIDLHVTITRFLHIWEKKLVAENVTVLTKFSTENPKIMADGGRLNQVFFHLCQNAVQSMPSGGTLTIETKINKTSSPNGVEIHFKDTGKGIPRDHLARLFDPFFTTQEVGKGKGLGLSFCLGIIRDCGGQISAHSHQVNQGSTFIVQLPVVSSSE